MLFRHHSKSFYGQKTCFLAKWPPKAVSIYMKLAHLIELVTGYRRDPPFGVDLKKLLAQNSSQSFTLSENDLFEGQDDLWSKIVHDVFCRPRPDLSNDTLIVEFGWSSSELRFSKVFGSSPPYIRCTVFLSKTQLHLFGSLCRRPASRVPDKSSPLFAAPWLA